MTSLWGEEFNAPADNTKRLLEKVNSKKEVKVESAIKSKKLSIEEKMGLIADNVHRILGVYEQNTTVIKTKQDFVSYINSAVVNGAIAIDTETNRSLDPLTCKLVGLCIYTPGQKNAYVPINHTDMSGNRLAWQCTEKDVAEQLKRVDNLDTIYHNGKFDLQVITCTCGFTPRVYWDTMIGARLLDENERAGLKQQYISKIDPSIEKYSIEHLFEGVDYELFAPELFALYAGTDAFMTFKLYEWQRRLFELPENANLFNLFMTVEMPVMKVASDMEMTGVCIDEEYAKRLSKKYQKRLVEISRGISEELDKYKPIIEAWSHTDKANYKTTGKSKLEQLEDPINVESPTQLAILLYDILNISPIDKEKPRGTGEEILSNIDLPICKYILQKRGVLKLLNTYIDKLPKCVSPVDNRLHAHFNQLGADTGRFSSSDPNLQNIPSHEDAIRMMFCASPGYVMVGSDFSQQEPRLLAWYSQDENMINAYKNGKDLYATIASDIYHNKYEDNLEHYPDGSIYKDGKERRTSVKSLMLGLMYGMGVASLAESIHKPIAEAQDITDRFFRSYPKVEKWIKESQDFAKKTGYVEDIWGRRRRLKDVMLPRYVVESSVSARNFNPLFGSSGINPNANNKLVVKYEEMLKKTKSRKEVDQIRSMATKDGITIKDNGGFIARAERQCANARIQGGAATMSKKAMILVHNDEVLNSIGFRLLIAVHDELIGECPIEYAEIAKERLSTLMKQSAFPECKMPMKCDADTFVHWYEDVVTAKVKDEYDKLIQSGSSREEAIKKVEADREELEENQIIGMISA